MTAVVTLSTTPLAPPARAEDATDPEVVTSKSALPQGCVSLGDVQGKHEGSPPRDYKAKADALKESRKMGATHFLLESEARCGAYATCYDGVAYRCAAPGAPAPAPAPAK